MEAGLHGFLLGLVRVLFLCVCLIAISVAHDYSGVFGLAFGKDTVAVLVFIFVCYMSISFLYLSTCARYLLSGTSPCTLWSYGLVLSSPLCSIDVWQAGLF